MERQLTVYVSYSSTDRTWKERLVKELRDLQADGALGNWDIWEDSALRDDANGIQAITNAIDAAQAAILLVSKSYPTSSFAQRQEVQHIFNERTRREDFLILPVLVSASDWLNDELGSRFAVQLFPTGGKPLVELEPEDAERELRNVARDIAVALRQAESELLSREPLPPEPVPPSSEQEGDKSTVDRDLLPLREVDRRYRFSPTARAVVDTARELAQSIPSPVPVTSSFLLFAMIDQGRSSDAYGVSNFLWNYIVERVTPADYESVRSRYLREVVSYRASVAEGEMSYVPALSQRVTRNALAVLEQAWILAQRLDEAEVHTRHLLAALLKVIPAVDESPQNGEGHPWRALGVIFGGIFYVVEDILTIGRADDTDLTIYRDDVSRHQAQVEHSEGKLILTVYEEAANENIEKDGEIVPRGQSVELEPGNKIRVAGEEIEVGEREVSTDSSPQGDHRHLQEIGIDWLSLSEAFLTLMEASAGERHHVWEEFLLGGAGDLRRLSGYAADAARGRDLIGISRDVSAFATLIAAQSVRPPLAIGLFGEWGSGKTFFMNQLRAAVDSLAKEMNETDKMQRDLPFYKRIVQIEFNAWHYVQGELWPSLMQHLLDNLRLPGEQESVSQELRNRLIQKLQEESTTLEAAKRGVEDAGAEIKKAEKEASTTRIELRDKERELEETSKLIDAQDFSLPEIKPEVDALLNALGMAPVSAAARDLGNALQEARGVLQDGNAILTPLVRAEDRGRRLLILLLGLLLAPLVGFLIGLIPALLGQEILAQITTLATGAAALMGALTVWLRLQTTWVKERIDKADEVKRQYDARVAKELADYREQMRQQEYELSELRYRLAAAERKKEEAERRVAVAQEQLDRATTTNLLADYIQDRAASQDYRKHLGVLALIRNDFEKLSNLMEEENWRLAPTSLDDDALSYTDKKYATLEEEKEGKTERINRIILYIDDLDRCPPNVVTDVLQAVHLLLAFPLFVVVVAVDARWIKRSLRARYEELLHTGSSDPTQDEPEEIFGKATPDDYLEKIFQIPFWLNPVGQDASRRMVEGLLQDSLTDAEPAEATADTVQEQKDQGGEPEPVDELSDVSSTAAPDDQITTQPNGQRGGRVPAERQPNATPEPPEATDEMVREQEININPTRLKITPSEMEFITELAPLLGRSPRALKRFVNVYRLVKAGLSEQEDRRFLMKDPSLSDYQAVLFLLAVDTGLPHIAQDFFDRLQGSTYRRYPDLRTIMDLNSGDPVTQDPTGEWSRLREWLLPEDEASDPEAKLRIPDDVNTLAAWKRHVLRYSFRTDQS